MDSYKGQMISGGRGINMYMDEQDGAKRSPVGEMCRRSGYNPRKTKKEKKYERYFNEAVTGSRCAFRTSDKKMES